MVAVKEANDLPQMDPHGLTDAAVRVFLLPRRSSFVKKKTACVKDSLNPVWNEQFEYKYVHSEDLKTNRVLELTVWDYDRRGCNDFIGCLRLGPSPNEVGGKDWMDSNDEEMEHWTEMLAHPGEWVEAWHNLRPSLRSHFASHVGDPRVSKDFNPLVADITSHDSIDESSDEDSEEVYSKNGISTSIVVLLSFMK